MADPAGAASYVGSNINVTTPDPSALSTDEGQIAGFSTTGLPATAPQIPGGSDYQAWFEQEVAGEEARTGGANSNPFSGFSLPSQDRGAFMGLIQQVETYMASVGYQYQFMPTAQMMLYAINNGLVGGDQQRLFDYFSKSTGASTSMPWASTGLTATQWDTQMSSLNATIFNLTGASSWAGAGFNPSDLTKAIQQNWSQQQLQQYIQGNAALNSKYSWVQYGGSYQQLKAFQASNAASIQARFGNKATLNQVSSAEYQPLQQFNAQGAVIGQVQTPSQSSGGQTATQTGRQSQVR